MANGVHPTMTETDYWNGYNLINDEIHFAIHSFYTWLEINKTIAQNKNIHDKLNSEAIFWMTILSSLQNAYFIVLGRIFIIFFDAGMAQSVAGLDPTNQRRDESERWVKIRFEALRTASAAPRG